MHATMNALFHFMQKKNKTQLGCITEPKLFTIDLVLLLLLEYFSHQYLYFYLSTECEYY